MLAWYGQWKFSVLLAMLVSLLVLQSFFEGLPYHRGAFHVLYSLSLITTILAFARESRLRILLAFLGLIAFLGTWVVFSVGSAVTREIVLIDRIAGILFLGISTGVILKRMVTATRVTVDTLIGSVCAYLLMAAAWGMTYSALEFAQPGAFSLPETFASDLSQSVTNVNDWIYYSFMTLTTLGYGDIAPVSRAAGTVTWLEAMAGQFYLALLVARLVGLHLVPVSATLTDD